MNNWFNEKMSRFELWYNTYPNGSLIEYTCIAVFLLFILTALFFIVTCPTGAAV